MDEMERWVRRGNSKHSVEDSSLRLFSVLKKKTTQDTIVRVRRSYFKKWCNFHDKTSIFWVSCTKIDLLIYMTSSSKLSFVTMHVQVSQFNKMIDMMVKKECHIALFVDCCLRMPSPSYSTSGHLRLHYCGSFTVSYKAVVIYSSTQKWLD